MSADHESHDESGLNRSWLGGVLVLCAVVLAAGAGLLDAAPRSPAAQPAGPRGVVVVDDARGSVHYGSVVLRGSTVSIIDAENETVVPRDRVRWIETETDRLPDAYWDRYPRRKVQTAVQRRAPKPSSTGCLVTTSGAVLVGALRMTKDAAEVTSTDGIVTRVPSAAIRWHAQGTDRPTADYWRQHADARIDPPYQRAARPPALKLSGDPGLSREGSALLEEAKKNPKVGEAFRAQGGDWSQATVAWFEAYASDPKASILRQLQLSTRNYLHIAYAPFRVDAVRERVDRLGELAAANGVQDRDEVRQLLAERISEAARVANKSGYPVTARKFVGRLGALGGVYQKRAEALTQELNGAPPTFLREGH